MDIATIIRTIFGTGWSFSRGFLPGVHNGFDFAAPIGKAVPALHEGRVVYSSFAGGGGTGYVHPYAPPTNAAAAHNFAATGGGNVVVVEDVNGIIYQYAHLSAFNVKVGDYVNKGTIVGKVGDTGDATGPHLHFAMFNLESRTWINPSALLNQIAAAGGLGSSSGSGTGSGSTTGFTTNALTDMLERVVKPWIGSGKTWNEVLTAAFASKQIDPGQYDAFANVAIDHPIGNIPITQADYNIVYNWFAANPSGGHLDLNPLDAVGQLGEAISSAGLFLGFIFVGAILILTAALVSRNSAPSTA